MDKKVFKKLYVSGFKSKILVKIYLEKRIKFYKNKVKRLAYSHI